MGTVIAICTSPARGTQKQAVETGNFAAGWGNQGAAHAGGWHRQVSLLSADKIEAFNQRGAGVEPGAFGENLVVKGLDFRTLPVGTLLRCGDVLLEMTQIGKECHSHCEIYKKMGDCIMPREGVFARVLEPGVIHVGDEMTIAERTGPRPWQAAVITLSDKGARGQREDKSGPAIAQRLQAAGYEVVEQLRRAAEPAERPQQRRRRAGPRPRAGLRGTGGTGFGPRDTTPEATLAVADRNAPGIAEAIRAASMQITPRAMLSRAVSVIRGKTLIINLPGSPRACMESMDVFLDTIPHAMGLLRGQVQDCARK